MKCDSGARIAASGFIKPSSLVTTQSIANAESLTFQIPRTSQAALVIAENQVARIWRSDTDYEEWTVATIVSRRDKGGSVNVTCKPLLYRLGLCGPVIEWQTDPANGLPQLDVGVSQLTATEIINTYILDGPIATLLPWLTLGTIEPTVAIDLTWNNATPLQVLRAIIDAIQATGELCELSLRRVSTTSYAIDILHERNSGSTALSLRVGKNLETLEYTLDATDRGTRIQPLTAPLAGSPTFLGAARWLITAKSTNVITLADPAGGVGPVGFDDQLNGLYLYSEAKGTYSLISDSDAALQTVTVASGTNFSVNGFAGFRTTTTGILPYYLEHPIYVQPTFPGVGVKFRTIDRTSVQGVANMVPNAIQRIWSSPTDLPDGYTFAPTFSGLAGSPTGFATFSQNTDPLYTKLGGKSLFFSIGFGAVVSAPIPFVPTRANQRVSLRMSLYLTQWAAVGAQLWVSIGIMLADGTVKQWNANDELAYYQPTSFRQTDIWHPLSANAWDSVGVQGLDITVPSTLPNDTNRVVQADIDALSTTAQGLVVMLWAWSDNSAGFTPVEGYLDGEMLTLTDEAPDEITEFGKANTLHQDTNVALGLLAPPQSVIAVSMVDLARMNPSLLAATDSVVVGGPALLSSSDLGLVNVPQRIVEVRTNHLKAGDTQIVLASKNRRLTELITTQQAAQAKATAKQLSALTAVVSGSKHVAGPSIPTLLLTYAIVADVPTITAMVSAGVVSVKFAHDPSAYPDAATVRLATADTTTPFTYDGADGSGGAMTPGDVLKFSAIATDNNGVESALVQLLVEDPVVLTGCALSSFALADTPFVQGDDFGGGNPPFTAYTNTADFDVFYLRSTFRAAYSTPYDFINDGVSHLLDSSAPFHGHPTLKMTFGASPAPSGHSFYVGAGWDAYLTDDADPTETYYDNAPFGPYALWQRLRWKADAGLMSDGSATSAFTGLAVLDASMRAWEVTLCNRQGRIKADVQVQTQSNSALSNSFSTTTYDVCDENIFVGAADFGELIMLTEGDDTAHTLRVRVWAGAACAMSGVSPLIDHTLTAYPRISGGSFTTSGTAHDGFIGHFNWFFTPSGANKTLTLADWELMPDSVDANPFGVALT